MDKYCYDILSALKTQYQNVCGNKTFEIAAVGPTVSARQFYLKDLNDNLIAPMSDDVREAYSKGNGNELSDKMRALRSSSAMTYNLLGNGAVSIVGDHTIGAGQYKVSFEKKFSTLRKSGGSPANLDAFLYCEQTQDAVACEMKMLEWICNKPGKISKAYKDKDNYPNNTGAVFTEALERLIDPLTVQDSEYGCSLQQYDAFQMFKHTLACYNACIKKEYEIKKMTLVNCVWELPDITLLRQENQGLYIKQLDLEHKEFDSFYQSMQGVISLFRSVGTLFDIRYYSLADFMQIMNLSNNTKQYLSRYTF